MVEQMEMVEVKYVGDALWERIERAVEIVKDRLRRVTTALNSAEVPYAVIRSVST
jgi:23S rRNA maturation mini-RNase III